jgi:hypothetical protein
MESNVFSLESRVEKNRDVLFRNLSGEAILLNLTTGHYFGLDPVGTRIWELIESKERLGDVLAAVLEEFQVDEDTARSDLLGLVNELNAKGLVEVSRPEP